MVLEDDKTLVNRIGYKHKRITHFTDDSKKKVSFQQDIFLHANNQRVSTFMLCSLEFYILLGATIPIRSSALTSVILNESTIQRREFSKESSPNSKTLTCS